MERCQEAGRPHFLHCGPGLERRAWWYRWQCVGKSQGRGDLLLALLQIRGGVAYLFLTTNITNYHKCSDQNSTNLLYSFGGQKSAVGLPGLKSWCCRAVFLSGGSNGESVFFPLPASRACLNSLVVVLVFHLHSQKWQVDFFSHHTTLTLSLLPPFYTFKDICDSIGPKGIIQDSFPISRSADQRP